MCAVVIAWFMAIHWTAAIVERMSWGSWFVTPLGESRIENAISAVKQVGSWFVEHNDNIPEMVRVVLMLLFAVGATRYLLWARGRAIQWILTGGVR
jgi:hypothetical protein